MQAVEGTETEAVILRRKPKDLRAERGGKTTPQSPSVTAPFAQGRHIFARTQKPSPRGEGGPLAVDEVLHAKRQRRPLCFPRHPRLRKQTYRAALAVYRACVSKYIVPQAYRAPSGACRAQVYRVPEGHSGLRSEILR